MGRPREFDESDVLDRALRTFWEHGYEGTSIDDLVAATGLGRASLYGAFGDKEAIFAKAVERYGAMVDESVGAAMDATSPATALGELLRGTVVKACPRSGPRGCFLLSSAVGGDAPATARKAYDAYTARLQRRLTELVERGQANGELTTTVDAASVARMLAVLLQGIAAGARAGRTRAELHDAADTALALAGVRGATRSPA